MFYALSKISSLKEREWVCLRVPWVHDLGAYIGSLTLPLWLCSSALLLAGMN